MKKLLFFLTALVVSSPLSAQINQMEFIRHQYLKPGFHFKMWDFDDGAGLSKYIQLAAPVTYSMALGPRLGIDVITSPFLANIEQTNGDNTEFHHASDTFVRGSVVLGDNLALLTVGVGVPTGETELNGEDFAMAGLAANRPLANPVSSFGTGSSLTLGLAVAQELGDWVVGAGVGYARRNEYEATFQNTTLDIKPGDELNLTVGVEREFDFAGGNARFLADIVYSSYSEDELNGQPFYEAGGKVAARGQLRLPLGIFNPLVLSVTQRWRGDNASTNAALVENGSELDLRATFYLGSNSFKFKGLVQSQNFGDTVDDSGGANIFGVGGGFVLNLSRHFTFDPTFIYHQGTLNLGPDSEIDITGLEARGGFAFRF